MMDPYWFWTIFISFFEYGIHDIHLSTRSTLEKVGKPKLRNPIT